MKVILFDIDGTLLVSRGIGREAKRRAMQECFGVTGDLDNHAFGGKTDWGILADLLAPYGRSAADIGRDMPAYEAVMARHMRQISGDYVAEPCPNAMELVQALRGRDDTLIGLVTGNTSRTAAIKLEMAGFAPDWFAIGAFGNESPHRDDLTRLARQRAKAHLGARAQWRRAHCHWRHARRYPGGPRYRRRGSGCLHRLYRARHADRLRSGFLAGRS